MPERSFRSTTFHVAVSGARARGRFMFFDNAGGAQIPSTVLDDGDRAL